MTKLTVSRIFDVSFIANTRAFQEMKPFVEYVNQTVDNLIRIMRNGIGVQDNVDAQVLVQSLKHNTDSTVGLGKRPLLVLLGRQAPTVPAITSFTWRLDDSNNLVLRVSLADAAYTGSVDVTLLAVFS